MQNSKITLTLQASLDLDLGKDGAEPNVCEVAQLNPSNTDLAAIIFLGQNCNNENLVLEDSSGDYYGVVMEMDPFYVVAGNVFILNIGILWIDNYTFFLIT